LRIFSAVLILFISILFFLLHDSWRIQAIHLCPGKFKEHILTAENLTRLVHLANEEMDSASKSYWDELDAISDEVANISHRLDRLYDTIETGKINLDDLAPRIHELRNRLGKLQARRVQIESILSDRRVALASPEIVKSYVDDLHNLLNRSSLAERRTFIRSFVKEVKVTGDEVLLTYTIPMLPRGVTEEKLPVLSIVHRGGR